jgi:hypothetical protein
MSVKCSFLVASSVAIGLASLIRTQPALAVGGATHDGVYGVRIVTSHGDCPGSYNLKVTIHDGDVRIASYGLVQGSGKISPNGHVSMTFGLLNHTAQVAGKIRGASGRGLWSSESMGCGGYWQAMRGT